VESEKLPHGASRIIISDVVTNVTGKLTRAWSACRGDTGS